MGDSPFDTEILFCNTKWYRWEYRWRTKFRHAWTEHYTINVCKNNLLSIYLATRSIMLIMRVNKMNDFQSNIDFVIVGCSTMDATVAGKAFYANTDSIIHGRTAANHSWKGNNVDTHSPNAESTKNTLTKNKRANVNWIIVHPQITAI